MSLTIKPIQLTPDKVARRKAHLRTVLGVFFATIALQIIIYGVPLLFDKHFWAILGGLGFIIVGVFVFYRAAKLIGEAHRKLG